MTKKAEVPTFEHRLSNRDRRRIARTLRSLRDGVDLAWVLDAIKHPIESIPMPTAVLCVNCDCITTSQNDCCPVCQSKGLSNLASLLMAEAATTFEHRLSDRDRKRIARTLRPLCDGVDLARVLAEIEMARRQYWSGVQYEKQARQSRKEMGNDLLQVAECAEQLLRAMDSLLVDARHELVSKFEPKAHHEALAKERSNLASDISDFAAAYPELARTTANSREDKILEKVVRMFVDTVGRMVSWEQLRYGIDLLRAVARNFDPRGRPRHLALYIYVEDLVLIYANAIGSKPRRRYNVCRPGEAEQLPFFAACMTAAGVDKYPSRIIRQVIEETYFDPENPDDNGLFAACMTARWGVGKDL